jgi:hypothetical protein
MKTRPALLRSIGVLLALLMFTALPNSVLGELCDPAYTPYCQLYYGHGTLLYLKVATDCPTAATIFYTITYNTPNSNVPCHEENSPTVCPPSQTGYTTFSGPNGVYISVPYMQTVYVNAIAWKLNMKDSEMASCEQPNPNE